MVVAASQLCPVMPHLALLGMFALQRGRLAPVKLVLSVCRLAEVSRAPQVASLPLLVAQTLRAMAEASLYGLVRARRRPVVT